VAPIYLNDWFSLVNSKGHDVLVGATVMRDGFSPYFGAIQIRKRYLGLLHRFWGHRTKRTIVYVKLWERVSACDNRFAEAFRGDHPRIAGPLLMSNPVFYSVTAG
jgi:hypothetical protein